MIPAIVRYNGETHTRSTQGEFTHGCYYQAFFLEYWEGVRDGLHVRGDDGKITCYNKFEDFTVISDKDNLLNTYEAIVRCVTQDDDDDDLFWIKNGKMYKAIGRDKNGMYLVMDETYCCYFYEPDCFEIIEDPHGILSKQSVYYSFQGEKQVSQ